MVFVLNPQKDGPKSVEAIKATALKTVLGAPPTNANPDGPKKITVQVGPNGQFVFEPPTVKANKGDIISFNFNPKSKETSL